MRIALQADVMSTSSKCELNSWAWALFSTVYGRCLTCYPSKKRHSNYSIHLSIHLTIHLKIHLTIHVTIHSKVWD